MNYMIELKYLSKKGIVIILCVLLLCGTQASAACTAIYVGSDVSADGSTIMARSNDFPEVYGNHITVTPRVENQPGRFMPVSWDGKVRQRFRQQLTNTLQHHL